MRRTAAYTVMTLLAALLLQGCLVHEWPSPPGTVQVRLILEYDTGMDTTEHGYGTRAVSIPEGSDIRYIVRAFPLVKGSKASQECAGEFVFSADASMGYDTEMTLELPEGDYSIMVWSDLVDDGSTDDRHYNTSDFSAVSLNGDSHPGNTDERDAFRGTGEIALRSSIAEKAPDTLRLMMERRVHSRRPGGVHREAGAAVQRAERRVPVAPAHVQGRRRFRVCQGALPQHPVAR